MSQCTPGTAMIEKNKNKAVLTLGKHFFKIKKIISPQWILGEKTLFIVTLSGAGDQTTLLPSVHIVRQYKELAVGGLHWSRGLRE
jgi:hypothetical protein